MNRRDQVRRPPLWLAAAAVASGWAAVYSVVTWVRQFLVAPSHDDVRLYYVAAEAGLKYGWSAIYDQAVLRSLSSSFPAATRLVDEKTFASTPLLAWVFAPLTAFPEPVAYVLWVVLSIAALAFAWRIAAPYSGTAKLTLLLLAIGLWPVLLTLYFGQPTLIVLALVAGAWWLCTKDRMLEAGVVLAVATFLKPQAVVLLPLALLVSGRYRVVAAWVAGYTVLGVLTVVSIGSSGLVAWWNIVRVVQGLPLDIMFTLAGPLGTGPLTYLLWGLELAAGLVIAWRRRRDVEVVFAVGLLATVATASYFHNSDYSILILPAWLVLRTSPPLWHRLWLAVGILPMQLLLTGFLAGPQLIWDAAWLAILAIEPLPALHAKAVPAEVVVSARRTDEAARRVGL
jgi:hypothetical protein